MAYKDKELQALNKRLCKLRRALRLGIPYSPRIPEVQEAKARRKLHWRVVRAIYCRLKALGYRSPAKVAKRAREAAYKRARRLAIHEANGTTLRRKGLTEEQRRESARILKQNRQARKRHAPGSGLTAGIRRKLFALQRGRCAACAERLRDRGPLKFHLDHIEPLALGGPHCDDNVQLLCPTCNTRKWAKDPIRFMQEIGKLL